MENLELSDIYPVAFLICTGLSYTTKREDSPNGKKRVIFIFDKEIEKARGLVSNYYAGQDDSVSASRYSRAIKDLKSLVFNL